MKNNNNNEKRFRQVKIINPLPLNKMMSTSITKQKNRERLVSQQLQNSRGRLDLQLTIEQPRKACFISITK